MERFLIVGLGNPGPRYTGNRHNIGYRVIDQLADDARISVSRSKFKSDYGTGTIENQSVVLLKPKTFMNLSGQAVVQASQFYSVEPPQLIVIHDELDLAFGTVRLKVGGGHAGHNGLRSIIGLLGSRDFIRLRIGVGRPVHGPVADFVLSDFNTDERPWLTDLSRSCAAAIQMVLRDGPRGAMNLVNQRLPVQP